MESTSYSNPDWDNPSTYQSLAETDKNGWLTIKNHLGSASSSKAVSAFSQAISDPVWIKKYPRQSLEGIRLIPNTCPQERHRVVKAIAEAGNTDFIQREADGMLRVACKEKDWDLAIELLLIAKLEPDASGTTAFHLLAESGTPEQIAKACDCLIKRNLPLNAKNKSGETPLHFAARNDNSEVLKLLLLKGASLNSTDNHGVSPLMVACARGNIKTALLLLDKNADIFVEDHYGATPLHHAIRGGNLKIIEELANLGLNVDARDKLGRTTLHWAIGGGKEEVIKLVVDLGAYPNLQDNEGSTALHIASQQGNHVSMSLLLQKGAIANIQDGKGNTPLFGAVYNGSKDACELLIRFGANPNLLNKDGFAPIHVACMVHNMNLVETLCEGGANLNLLTGKGNTLLCAAAGTGDVEKIARLIKLGATIDFKNKVGETPFAIACASNQTDSAMLLKNLGASIRVLCGNLPLLNLVLSTNQFSSEAIEDFIAADGGFASEVMERSLLAHRFGLKGTSSIADGRFKLEGMTVNTAIAHLSTVVWIYYAELKHGLVAEDSERWTNLLSTLSPSTLKSLNELDSTTIIHILNETASAISCSNDLPKVIERFKQGLPVGIFTEIPGHGLGMALYKGRLARCNRGRICGNQPGVVIHTIGNPTRIENGFKKCSPMTTEKYFNTDIKIELGLTDERYLPQKYQKVGNCAVANSNSMELALLYLQFEPLIGAKAAEELSRAIKKGRTKDTRVGSVEDYLNWHSKPRPYPPDLTLIRQLYLKKTADLEADREVGRIIREWVKGQGDEVKKRLAIG